MSQPASTAATAWRTLPHIESTSTLRSWHIEMTSCGMPSPAAKTVAPSSMSSATSSSRRWGSAVSRSTPNGLSVSARAARISARSSSAGSVDAPKQPYPPASDTAATSRW